MKGIFTTLGIVLMASAMHAQNAIEYNTFFNSGEFNFISEATNTNVDHGANGEFAEWNFEGLIEGDHAEDWFGEAVEPFFTTNPEYFENADLCLRTEGGVNKFWQHNEEGLVYLGYETGTAMLVLDNPLIHMPYPFALGQKHTDVGAGEMYGSCSDYEWRCELSAEVVGMGTLRLPNATFENAFKVKREVTISRISHKTGSERIYTSDEYVWYVNDVAGSVLEIKHWNRDVCYGPTEGKDVIFSTIYRDKGLSPDEVFEMNVFPNPTQGESTVRIKSDKDALVKLYIRDITGKEMIAMKFVSVGKGETIEEIDLTGLNPGVYMVEVADGSEKYTKKLIVE